MSLVFELSAQFFECCMTFVSSLIFRCNLQSDVRLPMYEETGKWRRAVGRRKFMGGPCLLT